MEYKLSFKDTAKSFSEFVTKDGRDIQRYDYHSVEALEAAFIENIDAMKALGFSSKAIGTAILVFKFERRPNALLIPVT